MILVFDGLPYRLKSKHVAVYQRIGNLACITIIELDLCIETVPLLPNEVEKDSKTIAVDPAKERWYLLNPDLTEVILVNKEGR